jgi:ABC-type phosphate transport system permease subunit
MPKSRGVYHKESLHCNALVSGLSSIPSILFDFFCFVSFIVLVMLLELGVILVASQNISLCDVSQF